MKKLLLAALWLPLMALAQTYPSPTYQNVTILGTLNVTGGPTFTSPVPVASGGTGRATLTAHGVMLGEGTGNVSLAGPSATSGLPLLSTGSSSDPAFSTLGLSALTNVAANTVLANATASSASPIAFSMPGCSASTNALTWTTSTGFTCNSAINAATLNGTTFAAPGPIGSATPGTGAFTTLSTTSVPVLPSQTANTFFAAPSGAAGVPGFRAFTSADPGNSLWVMPQTYGALANSNGTTGNGHDDGPAINSAIAAAAALQNSKNQSGGTVYLPCGMYRVATAISWTSTTQSVHLQGAGACAQIFNDISTATTTMTFSGGNCNASVSPCVSVQGINFVAPTNISSSAYALSFTGVSSPTIKDDIFNGYYRAITLTTSYAPVIINNTFSNLSGAALVCIADDSCNNAVISANRVFFVGGTASEAAFKFGPGITTGCIGNPDNILFQGNDLETSYGGVQFNGSCSVSIKDNYIAQNTAFAFNWGTPGYNRSVIIEGNYIAENGGTINGPGPWTQSIANVAGVNFGVNSWYQQGLTWSGLTSMNWSSFQALGTGASLQNYCTETQHCSYMTNGWIHQWGNATTSGGTASVTFPLACPTAAPTEMNLTDSNATNTNVWISSPTQTGMTVNTAVSAAFVTWSITCN